ncbi:hypothetical protein M0R04_13180 [Candidatus Dojkabacteria bacterium]|jgi:hypothetical protein|nr:hypothetical protein [Candidatus Dojkabacteria bacterium]
MNKEEKEIKSLIRKVDAIELWRLNNLDLRAFHLKAELKTFRDYLVGLLEP